MNQPKHPNPARIRPLFLSAVLALSPVIPCQGSFTSPAGWETVEGTAWFHNAIGSFDDARFMLMDHELRGRAMTFKGIAFRPDYRPYTIQNGMGRSWASVTIDLSECKYDTPSRTFSVNPTTTPTRVFAAPVAWPTQSGSPASKPAAWAMSFPFAPWSYSGVDDVCFDFRMTGGVLANGASWTNQQIYELDGVRSNPANSNITTTASTDLGQSGSGQGCIDGGATTNNGANITTRSTTYGPDYINGALRERVVFSQSGSGFGPNANVVTALGFNLVSGGTPFPGVGCNKLYLDPNAPLLLFAQQALSAGALPKTYFASTHLGFPYVASAAGMTLATQAAWDDTVNKELRLSNATRNKINLIPKGYILARHAVGYARPSTNPLAAVVQHTGTIWRLTN